MTKIIRPTYQKDVSLGILAIIFILTFFLSGQLFEKNQSGLDGAENIYVGEALASLSVVIMVIILWEELLFSVKIKPEDDGLVFRNHQTKLWIQALIYLSIPAIVVYLYFTFNVSVFRFFSWAIVCLVAPIIGKLVSGINNYNDFLKLTPSAIEYKNNQKEGVYKIRDISKVIMVKDDADALHKIQLQTTTGESVLIDLDEMELEAFFESIDEYITDNYRNLL